MKRRIHHPIAFKTGTRLIFLVNHNKDLQGGQERALPCTRTVQGVDAFDQAMNELVSRMAPGQRVYATAGSRSVLKASFDFRHRQIDAERAGQTEEFYSNLKKRWASCLGDPKAQSERLWLWDCDTKEENAAVSALTRAVYDPLVAAGTHRKPYVYATKSGTHWITEPFDTRRMPEFGDVNARILHKNPQMLWAYMEDE